VVEKHTHRCPGCGYDLTGLGDPALCPECGAVWTHEQLAERRRWWARAKQRIAEFFRRPPGISILISAVVSATGLFLMSGPPDALKDGLFEVLLIVATAFFTLVVPYAVVRSMGWAVAWACVRRQGRRPGRRAWLRVVALLAVPATTILLLGADVPFLIRLQLTKGAYVRLVREHSNDPIGLNDATYDNALYERRWITLRDGVAGMAYWTITLGGSYEVLVYLPEGTPVRPADERALVEADLSLQWQHPVGLGWWSVTLYPVPRGERDRFLERQSDQD